MIEFQIKLKRLPNFEPKFEHHVKSASLTTIIITLKAYKHFLSSAKLKHWFSIAFHWPLSGRSEWEASCEEIRGRAAPFRLKALIAHARADLKIISHLISCYVLPLTMIIPSRVCLVNFIRSVVAIKLNAIVFPLFEWKENNTKAKFRILPTLLSHPYLAFSSSSARACSIRFIRPTLLLYIACIRL